MEKADKDKKKKRSDWELEHPLDYTVTMEQLIDDPPFKEASDEFGQSTTAGTRIPLWLKRRIIKLKELPGSPYELDSDVTRDAIFIGLRVLHIRYKMSPDWDVETKLAATVDTIGAGRRIRKQVEELVSGLDEMFRDGDIEKAANNLTEYVLAAAELENSWHKNKLFKILKESKAVHELVHHCEKRVQDTIKTEGGKG